MEDRDLLRDIPLEGRGISRKVLEEVISLAVEIAREGREGRKIGTMFVVGDAEQTMKHSTSLIIPFQGEKAAGSRYSWGRFALEHVLW